MALFAYQKPPPLYLDYGILHIVHMKLLKNSFFKIVSYLASICCLFRKARSQIIIMNPVSNEVPELLGVHSKEKKESVLPSENA